MVKHKLSTGRQHQAGAVAIIFGLVIFVLFGFMALVIDLGRTYVVRTELQNAADAAALAGAKELDQTFDGVTQGVAAAITTAAQNKFKFSSPVVIDITNISVGDCPLDSCMVAANSVTTDALASGKTFLKVDVRSGDLPTFFARIPTTRQGEGVTSTSTFGLAVAGYYSTRIIPIGVCAIEPNAPTSVLAHLSGLNELKEFGFRRGISYNIPKLGPLGAMGDPVWLNPTNAPPEACDPSNSSTNVTRPFVCTGSSTIVTALPASVYANTGLSAGSLENPMNSRFNVFGNGSGGGGGGGGVNPNSCDPVSAPPDSNIYEFNEISDPNENWMNPPPLSNKAVDLNLKIDPTTAKPILNPTGSDFGVLWSFNAAVRAIVDGNAPGGYKAGTPFTPSDWPNLYPGVQIPAASYPSTGTPYQSGDFNDVPSPNGPGRAGRRLLNVVIVDCAGLSSGGLACASMPVLAIGKFFMQRKANLNGNGDQRELGGEFAGLLEAIPPADIKLYR